MSLPKTYRAARVLKLGEGPQMVSVPLQLPGPGQVLVKVLACGVCFSDLVLAQGHLGDIFPRTLGHELVGDVVAIGPDVTRFSIGERVGGGWHGGHDNACESWTSFLTSLSHTFFRLTPTD